MKKIIFTSALFVISFHLKATTWHVGPTQTYTMPSQLVNLVQDNDSVLIDGGVYLNDASKWTKKNLAFIGLGTGNNRSILRYTGNIPNGKGIFVFESPGLSDNPYIENIVFDGAQVSDANGGNGAGIRFQARHLTVANCKFMNCQNGILEGNINVNDSYIKISDSEFENNGYQLPNDPTFSGYEHHIYISASALVFEMSNCYLHHPRGQANSIKTRGQINVIEYNLIDEGDTGFGSYELNIAQGGACMIRGNVFIQGPSGANHNIVGYDAATNPDQNFYFVNNTVINKYIGNSKVFNIVPNNGIDLFVVYNNIFASVPGATNTIFASNTPSVLDSLSNAYSTDYTTFGFTNPSVNDYSLTSSATNSIDEGTIYIQQPSGQPILPYFSYNSFDSPLDARTINGTNIDIGAYELPSQVGLSTAELANTILYPNPTEGTIQIESEDKIKRIEVFSVDGKILATFEEPTRAIDLTQSGIFLVKLTHVNKPFSFHKIWVK